MQEVFTWRLEVAWLMIIPCILTAPGLATNYYVKTGGNDAQTGTSDDTAWATISKVNCTSFSAGDSIFFNRGDTWREQLTIPASGSSSSPITFGAYGSGNAPVITGANVFTGFSLVGGEYEVAATTEVKVVVWDGTVLAEGTAGSLEEGEWDWDSNKLYVKDNPSGHTVSGGQRDYCIYNDSTADYVTVDGLELNMANDKCLFSSQNDGWVIQNCNLWGAPTANLWGQGDPALEATEQATDWIVQDNLIGVLAQDPTGLVPSSRSGIQIRGMDTPIIRRNTIETINSFAITVKGASIWSDAPSTNPQVYENTVTDCEGGGIVIRNTIGGQVLRNHVYNMRGFAIQCIYNAEEVTIAYNLIHDLDESTNTVCCNGIDINFASLNGYVYNNTIYKVHSNSMTVEDDDNPDEGQDGPCDGWTIKNNIFDATENIGDNNRCIEVSSGVNSISLSNNNYVFDTELGDWKGSIKTTLPDWVSASGENNSISNDPLFLDAANADFRIAFDSPCRRNGIYVGLHKDYAGNYVPYIPDIGSYQHPVLEW